ncbi:hypothetical protein [Helicobacter rodentium]|uniref:hypothetical protein n=1 Tax=Helicobacter rodentium TaxID=59617 RepID=UPI0025A5896B|nr:hypothetical protein [Helicobacter rodentium]
MRTLVKQSIMRNLVCKASIAELSLCKICGLPRKFFKFSRNDREAKRNDAKQTASSLRGFSRSNL